MTERKFCNVASILLRIASILFLSIVIPLRWLAGNTQKLGHRDWGERSMGRAYDLLHSALVKILADPKLMLDYDFVLTIFAPLYKDLPKFDAYMDYYKEEEEGNVLDSTNAKDRVLAIDEAISELFYPTKKCNQETTEFCYERKVLAIVGICANNDPSEGMFPTFTDILRSGG